MQTRKLGRTNLDVSLICLGTMTYGEQNTESEGHQQMDYALEHGVNFFDTAELYSIPPKPETAGSTETIIGTWFKARKNRDKVILATKVVGRSVMTWFRKDGSPGALTRSQISEAVDGSLRRLQTDYIDLYQIHWPDRPMPWGSNPTHFKASDYAGDGLAFDETLYILDGFVKAGKIRHIGLSNESAWGACKFINESEKHKLPRVQSIQNAYNLLNRTYETALAEVSMREDCGLLAYSPLAQGYLSGKYMNGARPAGSRTVLFNRGQRYEKANTDAAITAYVNLAKEFGLDPSQMALAYVNSRSFVTSNIIGATRMEQLKLDIASVDVIISPELEERIDTLHQIYCNPAP